MFADPMGLSSTRPGDIIADVSHILERHYGSSESSGTRPGTVIAVMDSAGNWRSPSAIDGDGWYAPPLTGGTYIGPSLPRVGEHFVLPLPVTEHGIHIRQAIDRSGILDVIMQDRNLVSLAPMGINSHNTGSGITTYRFIGARANGRTYIIDVAVQTGSVERFAPNSVEPMANSVHSTIAFWGMAIESQQLILTGMPPVDMAIMIGAVGISLAGFIPNPYENRRRYIDSQLHLAQVQGGGTVSIAMGANVRRGGIGSNGQVVIGGRNRTVHPW